MNVRITAARLGKLAQAMCSWRTATALFGRGVLVGAEHRHVLRPDLTMILDIGANRGQFALAARQWSPNARVVSFEPLLGPARIFRAVFGEDPKVRLHEVAIGPEQSECEIHVSAADDSSSLLPISSLQTSLFPGTREVATAKVRVAPLMAFIGPEDVAAPAMLKLDVQGYELEALRGCESLLDRFAYVYVECSFIELYQGQALADEVIAYLRGRGFWLCGVYNLAYDRQGRAIQGDFLFESRES